eukprot:1189098-Pyramimonas_sp.AAC.1
MASVCAARRHARMMFGPLGRCVVCADARAKVAAAASASTSPSKDSRATGMSARDSLTASLTSPARNIGLP